MDNIGLGQIKINGSPYSVWSRHIEYEFPGSNLVRLKNLRAGDLIDNGVMKYTLPVDGTFEVNTSSIRHEGGQHDEQFRFKSR